MGVAAGFMALFDLCGLCNSSLFQSLGLLCGGVAGDDRLHL